MHAPFRQEWCPRSPHSHVQPPRRRLNGAPRCCSNAGEPQWRQQEGCAACARMVAARGITAAHVRARPTCAVHQLCNSARWAERQVLTGAGTNKKPADKTLASDSPTAPAAHSCTRARASAIVPTSRATRCSWPRVHMQVGSREPQQHLYRGTISVAGAATQAPSTAAHAHCVAGTRQGRAEGHTLAVSHQPYDPLLVPKANNHNPLAVVYLCACARVLH